LLRLYDLDLSPFAARCRLVVYKKGLGDRVELAPPPGGGPRSEAYRAINPIGKVPTLVLEDGTAIPESQVIAEYLEERFPEPPLMPPNPEGRARARLPVRVAELYLLPPLGRRPRLHARRLRADAAPRRPRARDGRVRRGPAAGGQPEARRLPAALPRRPDDGQGGGGDGRGLQARVRAGVTP
jgi:glutathione S-transferase